MPLLALHGFTGVGADFKPFAELCGLGQWHCPNLPGHGPDSQLDCTPGATVEYIQTQASSLSSQPSVLLGYSMGARAALLHACEYPEKWDALILISPNPGIEDEAARAERRLVDEKLAQRIEKDGVKAFIGFWQSTPMIRSQKNISSAWREAMQANREEHRVEGLAASLRQFGQGNCPNLWSELRKLTMPVLLITGQNDHKYSLIAKKMSAHIKTENLANLSLNQCGHMPHLEAAEQSAEYVCKFLKKV